MAEKRRIERIIVTMTPKEKAQLKQRALREKQSVSGVVRQALANPSKTKA